MAVGVSGLGLGCAGRRRRPERAAPFLPAPFVRAGPEWAAAVGPQRRHQRWTLAGRRIVETMKMRLPRLKIAALTGGLLWLATAAAPALAGTLPPPWRARTVTVPGPPLVKSVGGVPVREPPKASAEWVLVKLRQPWARRLRRGELRALEAELGGRILVSMPRLGMAAVALRPGESLSGGLARLRACPAVERAEPDYVVVPALTPNDPEFSNQWHHERILTPQAWDVTTGSPTTVIAVIDSGVDLDHPDLAAKIWTNADEIPSNGIDDDGNGFIDDVHGWDFKNDNNDPNPEPNGIDENHNGVADEVASHGTLVAGLAGAVGNDGWGTAGVDWQCKIMPIQVFDDEGMTWVAIVLEGIEYAIENGANVINLSIGAPFGTTWTDAIVQAYEAGITIVVAAGNDSAGLGDASSTWRSPVCNDGPVGQELANNYVLGVAYVDQYDRRGAYSNWDESTPRHFVDVSAPGQDIYGPAYYDPSVPGFDQYFYTNTGTSFAAPLASGLVGLLKAIFPSWGPAELIERVRSTADNIDAANPGYAGKLGTGRINCARAVGLSLPPRPPTEVRAEDTPGDEGGSITVSWTLSADDYPGGSVQSYIMMRRRFDETSFTQIATVPAGTSLYYDTAVENGVDYYYRVGAYDGQAVGWADPVGPAQARDDTPPPAVTQLVAYDTPGDGGGSITLEWTRYEPPADCAGYRIYRSNWPFDTVQGRDPIAELSGPVVRRFVDTSVIDGTDYYYAVVAFDDDGNFNPSVQPVGPVTSFPNNDFTVEPGVHFMSAPAVPADGDPASLFGNAGYIYARWDPAASDYALYRPGDQVTDLLALRLGRGFWLLAYEQFSFPIQGQAAGSGSLSVDLQQGWMQLGNPFFADMNFSQAMVQVGQTVMDVYTAEDLGYICATIYIYSHADGVYYMLSPSWGNTAQAVPVWHGFWLYCYQPCTLLLPNPSTAQAAASPAKKTPAKPAWQIKLQAVGQRASDSAVFLGAWREEQVRPAVKPPPGPTAAPRLCIVKDGGQYAALALREGRAMRWRLRLWPARGDSETLLRCDDSSLPDGYAATLVDIASGEAWDLRRQPVVHLRGSAERQLELQVTARRSGALAVTALAAVPAGRGAQISFLLSAPARVSVQIMNIAGRPIRQLQADKLCPAGENVVVWNGLDAAGRPVARGLYLIRVRATSDDGAVAQAIRHLWLR